MYAPTLREVPSEAEIPSHQLLLRAGFMRKSTNGMYTYLPLAWRVIKKIENIIRDEMDHAGCQEIMMPIMQPAEIWKESGRWDAYGAEMVRLKDRHGHEYCLGPTHEEMVTTLVKNDVRSYRQLPLSGNAHDDRYFLVQFLVYIHPLSAFAFVGCKELADKVSQCRANRFR